MNKLVYLALIGASQVKCINFNDWNFSEDEMFIQTLGQTELKGNSTLAQANSSSNHSKNVSGNSSTANVSANKSGNATSFNNHTSLTQRTSPSLQENNKKSNKLVGEKSEKEGGHASKNIYDMKHIDKQIRKHHNHKQENKKEISPVVAPPKSEPAHSSKVEHKRHHIKHVKVQHEPKEPQPHMVAGELEMEDDQKLSDLEKQFHHHKKNQKVAVHAQRFHSLAQGKNKHKLNHKNKQRHHHKAGFHWSQAELATEANQAVNVYTFEQKRDEEIKEALHPSKPAHSLAVKEPKKNLVAAHSAPKKIHHHKKQHKKHVAKKLHKKSKSVRQEKKKVEKIEEKKPVAAAPSKPIEDENTPSHTVETATPVFGQFEIVSENLNKQNIADISSGSTFNKKPVNENVGVSKKELSETPPLVYSFQGIVQVSTPDNDTWEHMLADQQELDRRRDHQKIESNAKFSSMAQMMKSNWGTA